MLWLVIFGSGSIVASTLAQNTPKATPELNKQETASVALDGRTIFKVSNSEEFDAQQRASLINSELKETLESEQSVLVRVEQGDRLPTLWLNDQYLMTVTERDSQAGYTVEEQARIWAGLLQQSINQGLRERSIPFIKKASIRALAILAWAFVLHWLIRQIWNGVIHRLLRRFWPLSDSQDTHQASRSLNLISSLGLTSARLGLWVAVILYIANQFPLSRRLSYQFGGTLTSTFTSGIIAFGDRSYTIIDLLILGSLIWGLVLTTKLAADMLRSRVLSIAGISRGAQEIISVSVRYVLIIIGVIVLLQIWGVDLSSLTIIASALGVGIGFGFQDIAKNFGSGLVLLFERPIQVGDFVEIGEHQGTIERVGARSTVMKTLDEVSIIVPNSRFLETELINWHHDNPVSGLRLSIGIAYGSDLEVARQALLDVARANPDVLATPAPQVIFTGFGDSSLDFDLRIWVAQPRRQVIIKSNLLYQIDAIFRERQIEIPFPQQDLYLRGQLPLDISAELKSLLLQLLQYQQQNGFRADSSSLQPKPDSSETSP
ncbi:MAG: mechanosensitive ion channel [Oscillatoriales cyanobacterium RM2_1_1]|nr:mechanosensitive ion channel [Oscillatoriales cyanobacterium RM2_1_1]